MSETKKHLHAFLAGLDSNDRLRLKDLAMSAFDEYVTEVPGPNKFVKAKIRPSVDVAIDNAIADLLS